MRIAICDDCDYERKNLVHIINNYCTSKSFNFTICEYDLANYLIDDFYLNKFQIIFLDIYMKGVNGIDLAKKIREIDSNCIIIFTTISLDHALDSYSVKALDYLIKPIDHNAIESTFNRCIPFISYCMKFIQVPSNRLLIKILQRDILYIEVFNKFCLIHTTNNTTKTYMTLHEIETLLDNDIFLKCHRSYIVNMEHIKDISENDFILVNNNIVPISKDKKIAIKQNYMDYLFTINRG